MAVDGIVTRPSSSLFWRAVARAVVLFALLVYCSGTRILLPTEIESTFLVFWKLSLARTRGTVRKQNPKPVHYSNKIHLDPGTMKLLAVSAGTTAP